VRIVVAVASVALIGLILAEFFITFLLPRRVKREPRVARRVFAVAWRPWKAAAARLPPVAGDTMLGIFGPLGLVLNLAVFSLAVILGFGALHWAVRSHLGAHATTFGSDLYFSASTFFSASTPLNPHSAAAKIFQVLEAAAGFGVLAIAIGYLPALFQAFSRRETAVSQLDPRAGSPPTAGALLVRSGERGGWPELDSYLREWETWTAEVMETHLSYPVIGYYRSQHVNQNWLAALTTVVDACAFAMSFAPGGAVNAAPLTFAIGRHALADLAYSYRARVVETPPERLPAEDLGGLCAQLADGGLELVDTPQARDALTKLRASYERYVDGIARQLALPLPAWLPGEDSIENWRRAHAHRRRDLPLP
jgi:hypothetical protein